MQATVHLDELHQEEKEAAEPAGTAVAPLEEPIIEGEVTAIIEPEQPTPMRRPYYLIPLCTLLACLIFVAVQNVLPLLTPTVTIFILPKTWTLATTASVQVQGRMLPALTLSQSQTVPATGHGHQEARRARGYVTFYNGSLTEATVPAGTEVTGSEGIRVVTDQSAFIPPASPPSEGQVTVLAHAFVTGTQGNIQAGDIAVALSNDVLAKNLAPFRGGQDERYFTIVSKRDIASAANQLATSLAKIEREALHAQLVDGEGYTPLCADLKTNPDHQIGDEATTVNVTVSETCSAIAYNEHTLHTVVAQFFTSQADKELGAGYSLLTMQVTVIRATAPPQQKPVVLSFSSTAMFGYALNAHMQERIKSLVAGQSKTTALQVLRTLQGIESAAISAGDFLPKDTRYIHLVIIDTV